MTACGTSSQFPRSPDASLHAGVLCGDAATAAGHYAVSPCVSTNGSVARG